MGMSNNISVLYLFKSEKWRNILLFVLYWGNAYLQIESALMLGRATNALIDHDIKPFMVRIGFALGLWSITIGVTYFQTQFQRNTINRMEEHMRWGIVDEVISQPYQDVVAKKPAAYASWLQNDVQLVENQAVNSFYYIMRFSGSAFLPSLLYFGCIGHWPLWQRH